MEQDQSVVVPKKIEPKRKFNAWVNNPVLEDYALRYAPKMRRFFFVRSGINRK